MKARLCSECGEYNSESVWNCANCGQTLPMSTLVDLDDSEISLIANESIHTEKPDATPTAEVEPSIERLREEITKTITYHLAAIYIARSDFPKKGGLPSPEPPPFNNFGHQLFLDYKLLLRIVWQSVDSVQTALKNVRDKKSTKILWGGGTAIVTLVVLLALSSSDTTCSLLSFGVAAFLGYVMYHGTGSNSEEKKEAVADVRAQAIEHLVNGKWEFARTSAEAKINTLNLVGDGVLDGDKVPVLIISDNQHPFPGYGRLQAENLFVCRPANDASEESSFLAIKEIRDLLSKNIVDTVSKEQQEVSFGEIVAIRGNSLHIDSWWLGKDKVPRLWLDRDRLNDAESIDPRASVRIYFAIQVLLPEYMTAATFFVRPFMACTSASCQIAVATIGPLVYGTDYLGGRLMRHRMEKDGSIKEFTQASRQKKTAEKDEPSLAFQQLRAVRARRLLDRAFQPNLNTAEIEKLSVYDTVDPSTEYATERKKAIEESVMWPGYLTTAQNLREANSLTFTSDFFGKTEAIASVKTLYDQIARTVLDSLDTLGFDISDYRDSEGHYSISADKIDQLVLGERIQITQTKESKETDTSQPSSGQASPKGTEQ